MNGLTGSWIFCHNLCPLFSPVEEKMNYNLPFVDQTVVIDTTIDTRKILSTENRPTPSREVKDQMYKKSTFLRPKTD